MSEQRTCLMWHTASQFELVQALASRACLTAVAAGSPERGRGVAELWTGSVRAVDDLRAALATGDDFELAIIAAGFGAEQADAAAVEAFVSRGGKVLSFEPLPASVSDLSAGWLNPVGGTALAGLVGFAGSISSIAVLPEALEALEQFGPVLALSVNCTAGAAAGSLGARLVSAMELVHQIAGEPELIHASLAQPRGERTTRAVPLTDLRGTLTADIRFADLRAATVLASSISEPWHRGVTVLGEGGRMRIWDDGFVWTGPKGDVIDELRKPPGENTHPAARHIALTIDGLYETTRPGPRPRTSIGATTVLAMAQAALLSSRTGAAESPETMRRVAESP